MAQPKKRPECVFGFYQAVAQPAGDISGGILITSHLGRPIEFQCSLPIRPNTTQQTLYGPTLRPFLVGELIAGALRDKLDVKPDVLFVNDPDALNAQTWGEIPVVCFEAAREPAKKYTCRNIDFWLAQTDEPQFKKILDLLTKYVPESADLREPLVRVEQALKEATGQAA